MFIKEPTILLNVKQDSDLFKTVCTAYETAWELAQKSEAWINDHGTMILNTMRAISEICDEEGKPRCDGLIFIQSKEITTDSVIHVMAISLSRSHNPAVHLKSGDKIGDFTVKYEFTVNYEQKLNRWILTTAGNPIELEYYVSEAIDLPLEGNDLQTAIAIFSGNLR